MTTTDKITYTDPGGNLCWFNPATAQRWTDRDHDGNGSGGTGRGQAVWRTDAGVWLLQHWTQWQGEKNRYEFILPGQARDWLLGNGYGVIVEEYLGPVEEEKTPEDQPAGELLDPLAMARNCLAYVAAAAAWQNDPDPERQIQAHINRVGAQADQDSKVAARMALVSLAEDVRRIADHVTGGRASAPAGFLE
jgi:hypothetical protein